MKHVLCIYTEKILLVVCRITEDDFHYTCRMGSTCSGQKQVKDDNFYKAKHNSNHIVSRELTKKSFTYFSRVWSIVIFCDLNESNLIIFIYSPVFFIDLLHILRIKKIPFFLLFRNEVVTTIQIKVITERNAYNELLKITGLLLRSRLLLCRDALRAVRGGYIQRLKSRLGFLCSLLGTRWDYSRKKVIFMSQTCIKTAESSFLREEQLL